MLEFFGWYRLRENDEFIEYGRAYGEDAQIVEKHGRKFLLVDDFNDAIAMRAKDVINAPDRNDAEQLPATTVEAHMAGKPAARLRRKGGAGKGKSKK